MRSGVEVKKFIGATLLFAMLIGVFYAADKHDKFATGPIGGGSPVKVATGPIGGGSADL